MKDSDDEFERVIRFGPSQSEVQELVDKALVETERTRSIVCEIIARHNKAMESRLVSMQEENTRLSEKVNKLGNMFNELASDVESLLARGNGQKDSVE